MHPGYSATDEVKLRFSPARPLAARICGPRTARPRAACPPPPHQAPPSGARPSAGPFCSLPEPGRSLRSSRLALLGRGARRRRPGFLGQLLSLSRRLPAAHTRHEARARSANAESRRQEVLNRVAAGSGRSILSPRGARARRGGGRLRAAAAQPDAGGAKVGAAGRPRGRGLAEQQRTEGCGRQRSLRPVQKRAGPGTLSRGERP